MPRVDIKKNEYVTKDFIKYLNVEMKMQDKKQEDIAELLGLKRQSVSYKFKNQSFDIYELIKIIHFLNIPAEEIGRRLTYE